MKHSVQVPRSDKAATRSLRGKSIPTRRHAGRLPDGPGKSLDAPVRTRLESLLGWDFSRIRVHDDAQAHESAKGLRARAFTIGRHIAFASGEFQPATEHGRILIIHEIAHALQMGLVELPSKPGHVAISDVSMPTEIEAQTIAKGTGVHAAPAVSRTGLHIARQPKAGASAEERAEEMEEAPAVDTLAGTAVTEIIISLARNRVGFRTPLGMIMGDVDTDLKVGEYELKPEVDKRQWTITSPAVKTGLRFNVTLESANPWSLRYPATLRLTVAPGLAEEPETFGEMLGEGDELLDPLWFYEGMPPELKPRPIAGVDDFDWTAYDLDYRHEGGNLSMYIKAFYRDNTSRDFHLDSITEQTPRLWAAKQEAYRIMDEYNTLFILGTFPAVFFIITMAPSIGTPSGGYRAIRQSVPKSGASVSKGGPSAKGTGAPKGTGPLEGSPAPKNQTSPKPSPQSYGGGSSAGAAKWPIKPVNGRVNAGGGLEKGAESATNLNPVKPGSGGPSKGIPNHVKAGFEDIGRVFEPGSVKEIISNRLRYGDVNWTEAARGSAHVMAKNGRLSLNVWTQSATEQQTIVEAFRAAGFKDVQAIGEGTATIIVGRF